jgi:type II secretory pathway pseudopilin PulG
MAALLISLSIMALLMTAVMPVWKQTAQREKEAELVFRGQQYVHAIALFQRKAGPGTYPPSFDLLVEQKFLRRKYKDPITNGDFQPLPAVVQAGPNSPPRPNGRGNPAGGAPATQPFTLGGASGTTIPGGIAGVMSKSTDASIRIYNGQSHYNEWVFRFVAAAPAPGAGAAGAQRGLLPNQPPGPGGVGGVGGRGPIRGAPPAGGRGGGPNGRGGFSVPPLPPGR